MLNVFKTKLEITDEQKVQMQKGSSILKVARQGDDICVWYLCDPERELQDETFYVVGTGNQLPDTFPGAYIDSVIIPPFVWHVFFKRRPNVQRGKTIVASPNDPGQAHTREGGDNGT